MAEFTTEQKNRVAEQARDIRDFITRDIVDYFWKGEADEAVRADLNKQLNYAIERLQELERRTRG